MSASDVVVLVLSYDSPVSLTRCLDAIDVQTVPPRCVIVTDNASPTPVDLNARVASTPVEVHRLPTNTGPAGGHAAGLARFLETDAEWAWVLDDDIVAEPDALALLLAECREGDPLPDVVMPMVREVDGGQQLRTQGWCGVLIRRQVVEKVGLPNEALFWWTEDTEYLQWRIPNAGFAVRRSEQALVGVYRSRGQGAKPAWKYYYEARNQLYHRVWVQRPVSSTDVPRHLTKRVRYWRAGRAVSKLAGQAALRERDGRVAKLTMVGRGAFDGLVGRLGIRVAVDQPDRPQVGPR
jgi:rhamnopyranosyl-N-acetylglucosaminyl-diphospho-decaprenol beta-1,3/1,4-galactofuranosyltransferase